MAYDVNNEPIYSVLDGKTCTGGECLWEWYEVCTSTGWSMIYACMDPCTCPYPDFNGFSDGDTTTTLCS